MCKINGKKLAKIRNNAGVSKSELAKKIGVSGQTISNYENGTTTPTDENVAKICMILKINQGEIEMQSIDYDFKNGVTKTIEHERRRLGKKRYKNPIQTEEWIASHKTISEDKANGELKAALKGSVTVAGKKYVVISPEIIHIPHWQRDTDFAKAMEIKTNYDPNKLDPIKIYVVNGKAFAADGAHRLVAFVLLNEGIINEGDREKIVCEVIECTEMEAVNIFLRQQSGRKTMSVNDTYRAAIKAGNEDYMKLKEVCENKRIQILAEEKMIDNPIGTMKVSGTALRLASNPEQMTKIIDLINDLNWSGSEKNVFTMRNFNTIKRLFSKYGESIKERMLSFCKGAAFYEAKVLPVKSNAELFDVLVHEMKM